MLPNTLLGEWVKGHYIGKNRQLQHTLNDLVEKLATDQLGAHCTKFYTLRCPSTYPCDKVRLKYDNSVITSKLYRILTESRYNDLLENQILRKTKWSERSFQKVEWDAHRRAFTILSRSQQTSIAKLIHHLANTNNQNHLYYAASPLCPGCTQVQESFEHVLLCQNSPTVNCRQESLTELQTTLKNIQTPTKVFQAILQGFRDSEIPPHHRSRAPTFGSLYGPDVLIMEAYYEQFHVLGWYQLSLGRISLKWAVAVEAYQQAENNLATGGLWSSLLIAALWKHIKNLWKHRNEIVHSSTTDATATIILKGLKVQVRQHYAAFSGDPGYVLPRHAYLFTQ